VVLFYELGRLELYLLGEVIEKLEQVCVSDEEFHSNKSYVLSRNWKT